MLWRACREAATLRVTANELRRHAAKLAVQGPAAFARGAEPEVTGGAPARGSYFFATTYASARAVDVSYATCGSLLG